MSKNMESNYYKKAMKVNHFAGFTGFLMQLWLEKGIHHICNRGQ